jgi:putative pyruvate formate lyase activating enzyme
MKKLSRRECLRYCIHCALATVGSVSTITSTNCRSREKPLSQPAAVNENEEGKNMQEGTTQKEKKFEASYLKLHRSGELKKRGQELWDMMECCELCPRYSNINRLIGEKGACGATSQLDIASFHPHFGEERPLVGTGGSGTIFFTHCSLKCVFCINWEISQGGEGKPYSIDDLAEMMLKLQRMGCHNINVVTPTHYSAHIVLALDIAAKGGLTIPVVYNTCGWERVEILQLLDGIVDIYLPDFKYADGKMANKYSSSSMTYPDITKDALLEMHRQVGVAKPSRHIMQRGLMIRHLVMPNNVGGSCDVIKWIATNLPKDTYVNIMSQYTPYYRAKEYPEIARRITRKEYGDVIKTAQEMKMTNIEIQGWPL